MIANTVGLRTIAATHSPDSPFTLRWHRSSNPLPNARAEARKKAERHITDLWPLARDVGGIDGRGLATAFRAQGSPMTVISDAAGEPVDVIRGGISGQALIDRLEALFEIDI